MKTLEDWLAYCEQLHPKAIDMGLDRVRAVAQRMGIGFDCPVITVAGTNGKGSTCAMLEAILREEGYRTGVYSSPHLVRFEERLLLDGQPVNATKLIAAFASVERARTLNDSEISLTYFEFSTLAIMDLMSCAGLGVAILEVGLGGRLDAVNIIDTDCAVITGIDLDHMQYLGTDREQIGLEKAGIMRAGRPVVLSEPTPPQSVLDHATTLGADLWRAGVDFEVAGGAQGWSWAASARRGAGRFENLPYPALPGGHQRDNAAGVLAALTALRESLPVSDAAVRRGLSGVELPGRFQVLAGLPTLVLDVAHNPHAVASLAGNLASMGGYPKTHAVFGAMADKDVGAMLGVMTPWVDHWYFADLPTARAASAANVLATWQARGPTPEKTARTYTSAVSALQAAMAAADPADRIVVFGSFYTVGGILNDGLPR